MTFLRKLIFGLAVLYFVCAVVASAYYNPGSPTGYVTDFANTLNAATVNELNQNLTAFEKETGHQIFVAIIPSMKDDYIENFSVKLFEDWKPGYKGLDNGVLFLISMEERKMRIEVGYGLEGILTDSKASQIINDVAKPYFQAGDFDNGVKESVNAIKQIIKGEIVDFEKIKPKESVSDEFWPMLAFWALWLIIIGWKIFASIFAKTKSWWLGGVVGGIVGIALSIALFSVIGLLVIPIFIATSGGGLLLDYLASTGKIKIPQGKSGGRWGGFWGGGGGGFGGSGGFGGGGGGSSGGGGASGGW